MSIYSEIILDHYQNPRNFGKLKQSTNVSKVSNPLCGDEIELGVVVKNNRIKEIKFKGQGCAISLSSSSMLTMYLKGKDLVQLKNIDKDFIIKMLGIELGVNRIKCALLPLEALKKLF